MGRHFDQSGNVTQLAYPGGRVIDYNRDEMNRLTSLDESATDLATYEYQAYKERVKTLASGISSGREYGLGEEVVSILDQTSGLNAVVNFEYGVFVRPSTGC